MKHLLIVAGLIVPHCMGTAALAQDDTTPTVQKDVTAIAQEDEVARLKAQLSTMQNELDQMQNLVGEALKQAQSGYKATSASRVEINDLRQKLRSVTEDRQQLRTKAGRRQSRDRKAEVGRNGLACRREDAQRDARRDPAGRAATHSGPCGIQRGNRQDRNSSWEPERRGHGGQRQTGGDERATGRNPPGGGTAHHGFQCVQGGAHADRSCAEEPEGSDRNGQC